MKKIALVFLLTFVSKIGFSQKNADLINILSQIRQTQLYQECQKFKNTVETLALRRLRPSQECINTTLCLNKPQFTSNFLATFKIKFYIYSTKSYKL